MGALLVRQALQGDGLHVFKHGAIERIPQGLGIEHAGAGLAGALWIAHLFDGANDVGHRDTVTAKTQGVAATGAARALDQAVLALLGKHLLQVRQGNTVAQGQVG